MVFRLCYSEPATVNNRFPHTGNPPGIAAQEWVRAISREMARRYFLR